MTPGDKLTITGIYKLAPNQNRRWWQLWKPRMIVTGDLQEFTIRGI